MRGTLKVIGTIIAVILYIIAFFGVAFIATADFLYNFEQPFLGYIAGLIWFILFFFPALIITIFLLKKERKKRKVYT